MAGEITGARAKAATSFETITIPKQEYEELTNKQMVMIELKDLERLQNADLKWQRKLLPYMIAALFGLTIFFIAASYLEFSDFKNKLELTGDINKPVNVPGLPEILKTDKEGTVAYTRWQTLVTLEQDTLNRRYNHSKTVILARMWTRYLGFLTGMILSIVGAIFVLGKLREAESKFDGEASEILKLSITSASPGLILAVLGTLLILTTIVISPDANVQDGNLYLLPEETAAASTTSRPGNISLANVPLSNEDIRKFPPLPSRNSQNDNVNK